VSATLHVSGTVDAYVAICMHCTVYKYIIKFYILTHTYIQHILYMCNTHIQWWHVLRRAQHAHIKLTHCCTQTNKPVNTCAWMHTYTHHTILHTTTSHNNTLYYATHRTTLHYTPYYTTHSTILPHYTLYYTTTLHTILHYTTRNTSYYTTHPTTLQKTHCTRDATIYRYVTLSHPRSKGLQMWCSTLGSADNQLPVRLIIQACIG